LASSGPLPRLLDPKLDVVFKMMFARAESRDILVALLTAVLRPPSPIVEVTVQSPEVPHMALLDKDILLDLVVRLRDESVVDVEMQTEQHEGAMARALYYWARLASSELHPAEPYCCLRRVVVILLLGYRAFPATPFHGIFDVRERASGTLLSDRLEIHTVELPRLAELGAGEREAERELWQWAQFLNARDRHELEELATMNPIMERAKSILEELSADPVAQEVARQRELALLNRRHAQHLAHQAGFEEGKTLGLEEGKTLGLAGAIVAVLGARGIALDAPQRARLEGCRDLARLERWLARAAVATTADEALAE
jgi:predicted transposase/invertase (TIGR01784 family)